MTAQDDRRQAAIGRLKAKRDFRIHLAVYLIVNTMLVVIWAATGAGYFWPIWPIAGWGIGLAFHAFNVYFRQPISEDDIQAEMGRARPHDMPGD
jgi:uncharacterized membrane protein